jgi:hypothetical protein
MNEEVMKVLEMVKSGRITPEEGEKLLSALGMGSSSGSDSAGADQSVRPKKRATILRIRVDAEERGRDERAQVNLNVPLSLAKKLTGLLKLIPKDAREELDEQGIDLGAINLPELIELFENGEIDGDLVHIDAGGEGNGAKVRIYVE